MSKVTASTDIDKVSDDDVSKYTEMAVEDIVRVLNGDVDFDTNIRCKVVSATFAAANTQQAVTHNLGKVPTGYFMAGMSAPMAVYDGSSAKTASVIYLQASAPATVTLVIF